MSTINPNWGSWVTTSINATVITDTNSATSGEIDNDNKAVAEVSVTCAYGSPATEGLKVYIVRDIEGTNFEGVADDPFAFMMPKSVSTTHRKTISLAGDRISKFKVIVSNDSGASVTVTVRYKQATIDVV